MNNSKRARRLGQVGGAMLTVGLIAGVFGTQGCLDRPVVPIVPGSASLSRLRVSRNTINKIDLLLVIDDSLSMADKQSELGTKVPGLIKQLTNGTTIDDMHVAVISSSLGAFGIPNVCAEEKMNTHAHVQPWKGAPSPLSWRVDGEGAAFHGSSEELQRATGEVVQSVGEHGCGQEQTWEAMYRFLIDPVPYKTAALESCEPGGDCHFEVKGQDDELLAQRKAFLRPDSLLTIVILSDENDMSLRPSSNSLRAWSLNRGSSAMRGNSKCAGLPDDIDPSSDDELSKLGCRSCIDDPSMPECVKWPQPLAPNVDADSSNLRNFNQVQRFGIAGLYERQRYISALSNPKAPVLDSFGKEHPNPLFGAQRDASGVVVATIVGVPRQLVEDSEGKAKEELDWEKIVGPIGTRDPHMIESIEMRAGIAPYKGEADLSADDPKCQDGSLGCGNGGDRIIPQGKDLQFACIAERSTPDTADDSADADADCPATDPDDQWKRSPLCAAPLGGKPQQPNFKAYPGLRHLRIVRALGKQGFVASICNQDYGKAVGSLADKLKKFMKPQCFDSILNPKCVDKSQETCAEHEKAVDCLMIEAFDDREPKYASDREDKCESLGAGYCTPGRAPCRVEHTLFPPIKVALAADQLAPDLEVSIETEQGIERKVKSVPAQVDEFGNVVAGGHLLCEVVQVASGRTLDEGNHADPKACINQKESGSRVDEGGFCYTRSTVECVTGAMQFVGNTVPKNNSVVTAFCPR